MSSEVVERLLASRVVDELHALLWAKPRVNRGERDLGWSCREHAASIAALLALEGVPAKIRHGHCAFVQGGSGSAPPVALTQQSAFRPGHSWAWVEGFGDIDVSARLRDRVDRWRPVDTPYGIVGDAWPVAGLTTDAFVLASKLDYENRVNEATHFRDAGRAVYLVQLEEPFEASMLVNGETRLNSPLTARIVATAGPAVYVKLVSHLRGVLAGERRSLSTVSFGRAWQAIGEISQQAADLLLEDLRATPGNQPRS